MKLISDHAINILLGLLLLVVLFHFSLILKLVPYNIAWGGRLETDSEMYVFETISILIKVFFAWVLLMEGNFVKFKFSLKTTTIILWGFLALFILNTIGNIFSKTNFEKFFAILTALFAVLLWRILITKKKSYGST